MRRRSARPGIRRGEARARRAGLGHRRRYGARRCHRRPWLGKQVEWRRVGERRRRRRGGGGLRLRRLRRRNLRWHGPCRRRRARSHSRARRRRHLAPTLRQAGGRELSQLDRRRRRLRTARPRPPLGGCGSRWWHTFPTGFIGCPERPLARAHRRLALHRRRRLSRTCGGLHLRRLCRRNLRWHRPGRSARRLARQAGPSSPRIRRILPVRRRRPSERPLHDEPTKSQSRSRQTGS